MMLQGKVATVMRRTVKGGKPGGSAPGAGTGAPSWYGPGMQTPDLTRSHLPFSCNAITCIGELNRLLP